MNIWDILILAGVALLVFAAVRGIRKGKAGGCGCGCEGCTQKCGRKAEK